MSHTDHTLLTCHSRPVWILSCPSVNAAQGPWEDSELKLVAASVCPTTSKERKSQTLKALWTPGSFS